MTIPPTENMSNTNWGVWTTEMLRKTRETTKLKVKSSCPGTLLFGDSLLVVNPPNTKGKRWQKRGADSHASSGQLSKPRIVEAFVPHEDEAHVNVGLATPNPDLLGAWSPNRFHRVPQNLRSPSVMSNITPLVGRLFAKSLNIL